VAEVLDDSSPTMSPSARRAFGSTRQQVARVAAIVLLNLVLLGSGLYLIYRHFALAAAAGVLLPADGRPAGRGSPTEPAAAVSSGAGLEPGRESTPRPPPWSSPSRPSAAAGATGSPAERPAAGVTGAGAAAPPIASGSPASAGRESALGGEAPGGGEDGGPAGGSRSSGQPSAEEVNRAINEDGIRMVVGFHMAEIRGCYERALKSQADLAGRVEVLFTLDQDGRAQNARPAHNSTGSEGLARCVAATMQRWKFPRPAGGPAEFVYPFVFAGAAERP
jgi:TonB family protein